MKYLFRFVVLLAFILVLIAVLPGIDLSFDNRADPAPSNDLPPPEPDVPAEPDIRTATLAAVGGLYPHRPVLDHARQSSGEYDFSHSFEFIAPHLQEADIAMVVLETMQAGPDISAWGVSGYTGHTENNVLTFNAPIQLSEALKSAGFNMYIMASNHSLDRGLAGLKATLENVRNLGFITTGAYLNREERDTPDMLDINGIKVALVSYTYGTNGLPVPAGHEYAVNISRALDLFNPISEDINPIIADIESARAGGADLVAVLPHWGDQYNDTPPQHLRDVARRLAEAGADLIIGQHPKYVQPMEWIDVANEDGTTRPALAVYSLGNFYTNQHYRPPGIPSDLVQYGLLLSIELSKDMDSNEAWISNVEYDIHWCYREWGYRMLVLSEVFEQGPERYNLTGSQFNMLKDKFNQNVEIVERYGFSENMPWNRAGGSQ